MAPLIIYLSCIAGAAGLFMIVRPRSGSGSRMWVGALLAVSGLIGAFALLPAAIDGQGVRPDGPLFIPFALLAVVCAVQMISTPKPVYAALYFVLVILASAGLILLLEAEFIAFAVIIVYAGAIMITYMFVLMLAQQSGDQGDEEVQPAYDRFPREPGMGVIAGFFLLVLLSRVIMTGTGDLSPRRNTLEARHAAWEEVQRMPEYLATMVTGPDDTTVPSLWTGEDGRPQVMVAEDGLTAGVAVHDDSGREVRIAGIESLPGNTRRVGYGLVLVYPVSLELAGVILLMAMFGAIILARRQIEMSEDEQRAAAGMPRLGHHDDPADRDGGEAAS